MTNTKYTRQKNQTYQNKFKPEYYQNKKNPKKIKAPFKKFGFAILIA